MHETLLYHSCDSVGDHKEQDYSCSVVLLIKRYGVLPGTLITPPI